jgi:hypothetical protein
VFDRESKAVTKIEDVTVGESVCKEVGEEVGEIVCVAELEAGNQKGLYGGIATARKNPTDPAFTIGVTILFTVLY